MIWLTIEEKELILSQLEAQIDANTVDAEFIPYLRQLNALPSVCTTQCCSGHSKEGKEGYISLRFSERVDFLFKENLTRLLLLRGVTNITECFELWPNGTRPRTSIQFDAMLWPEIIQEIVGVISGLE